VSTLWLVRHGPTHARAVTGWRDIPADLTDSAALARLSAALPDAPVVSSDLIRAVATADAIAGTRERLPHERDLREMDFGDWDGLTYQEISARDPALSRSFWTDPAMAAPPGGEGWEGFRSRVLLATQRLVAAHGELVVVAHFGTILALVQEATGETPAAVMGRPVTPLSLTEISLTPSHWNLRRMNVLS